MMRKILIPLASRSETVKLAPVIKLLRDEYAQQLATRWIHIGPNPDLVWQTGALFGLTPHRQIPTDENEDDLHALSFQISKTISDELDEQRPDLLLVQGDSLQAVLSAQQGFIRRIPIVHIDAGRRANGSEIDYQKESNRRMLSALATFHCVANAETASNLRSEGFPSYEIGITGNPIVDAAQLVARTGLLPDLSQERGVPVSLTQKKLLVVIQSPDTPRSRISEFAFAIANLARDHKGILFTIIADADQRGARELTSILGNHPQVRFVPPMHYLHFAKAVKAHHLVLTDSSDIQYEVVALGTPALLMRPAGERQMTLCNHDDQQIGCSQRSIVDGVTDILSTNGRLEQLTQQPNPLGDGKASSRIGRLLANWSRNNILTPRAFEPFTTLNTVPLRADGSPRRYHTSF
jgi:UDP-N-acetylglucosamine 2-epimerase (non-hydrolysing)